MNARERRRRARVAGVDASARLRALRALPLEPDTRERLLEAAAAPSPDVAREALARLARLGGSRETAVLRGRMLHCEVSLVADLRAAAVAAVARLAGRPDPLLAPATTDPEALVRLAAARHAELLDADSLRRLLAHPEVDARVAPWDAC